MVAQKSGQKCTNNPDHIVQYLNGPPFKYRTPKQSKNPNGHFSDDHCITNFTFVLNFNSVLKTNLFVMTFTRDLQTNINLDHKIVNTSLDSTFTFTQNQDTVSTVPLKI
jgi:hypothetical protein